MEKQAALEHIDYLKKVIQKTTLSAYESYPILIMWGVIWMLGYIGTIWFTDSIWYVLGPIGGLLNILIGKFWPWSANSDLRLLLKVGLQSALIVLIFLLYPLFFVDPVWIIGTEVCFWPIMIGVIYINFGLMISKEMVVLGIALIALAVLGISMTGTLQNLWYGLTCGGIMIVTGFYFRAKRLS